MKNFKPFLFLKDFIVFTLWTPVTLFWLLFLFSFKIMCNISVKFGMKTNKANNLMVWSYKGVEASYQVKNKENLTPKD
jgi:hypothetical protein